MVGVGKKGIQVVYAEKESQEKQKYSLHNWPSAPEGHNYVEDHSDLCDIDLMICR